MKTKHLLAFALIMTLFASCAAPKDVTYFQDVRDGSDITVSQPYQVKIQPGDKLRIIVSTQDSRLSQMFNLGGAGSANTITSTNNGVGYTVTSYGDIDFPTLGHITVAGLTRQDIAETIKTELQKRDLVKDPVVVVDFLNMGVSVLGDVRSPGHYSIVKDRYTILEAIADAGDLNVTGKRTNIKVIREEVGRQTVYEVNLLDAASLYTSPVFFMQQNDVIYVEPNDKVKRGATINGNTTLTYGFWMSLCSFLMSTAVFIFR